MKTFLLTTVVILVSIGLWLSYESEDRLWLLFNEESATIVAEKMLRGEVAPIPDEFIDYSISSSSGCVFFTSHHSSEKTYAFVSGKAELPADFKGSWERIDGNWYVEKRESRREQ